MSKRVKWLIAAAAGGLMVGPASANHSWASYHWPVAGTNQPFEVYTALTEGYWRSMLVDGQPVDIIGDAIGDWDGQDPHLGTYKDYLDPSDRGPSGTSPKKCNPLSQKILVCSAYYGFRGWLGVATIWINGDHIYQATTKLNDSYHSSGTYSSYSWRALVGCQEIGHDFGLGHQNEDFDTDLTQSCMEYTKAPENNETPDGHDYEQLQIIYDAHMAEEPSGGDGGGGGGKGPPSGKGPNKADAFTFREVGQPTSTATTVRSSDWGTAIGYDAHGRPNVFELDLGKRLRKITHVTWVPGFRPQSHHMRD